MSVSAKKLVRKASKRTLLKRWEEWLKEAEQLWVRGDYSGCHCVVERLLEIREREPIAMGVLGICCYYEENLGKAKELAVETLNLDNDSLLAHLILSQCKRRQSLNRIKRKDDTHLREAMRILASMKLNTLNSSFWYTVASIITLLAGYDSARRRSIGYASKALELEPLSPLALNTRGVSRGYFENAEDAIADFTKAIELNPKFANAYFNRGNTFQHLGDTDRAIQDFDRATELSRGHMNALFNRSMLLKKKGEFSGAISSFRKTIELDESSVRAYMGLGECNFATGNYQTAIDNFTHVIQMDGELKWKAYYERSRCYFEVEEEEFGMDDLKETLSLNPRFVPALLRQSRYYIQRGDLSSAIEALSKALDSQPYNASVMYQRANLYYKMEEYAKAADDFKKVLSAVDTMVVDTGDISMEDTEKKLGLCFMKVKEYSNAIRMWNRVLDKESSNVEIREKRAECFLHEKRYNDAISEFDELISIGRGDKSLYHFRKAETFVELGELEKGVLEYRASTSLNSRFGIAFFSSGNLLERMERYSEAIDEYEKCLKFEDLDAVCIREHRSRCYSKLGKHLTALEEFDVCVSLEEQSCTFNFSCDDVPKRRIIGGLGRICRFFRASSPDLSDTLNGNIHSSSV